MWLPVFGSSCVVCFACEMSKSRQTDRPTTSKAISDRRSIWIFASLKWKMNFLIGAGLSFGWFRCGRHSSALWWYLHSGAYFATPLALCLSRSWSSFFGSCYHSSLMLKCEIRRSRFIAVWFNTKHSLSFRLPNYRPKLDLVFVQLTGDINESVKFSNESNGMSNHDCNQWNRSSTPKFNPGNKIWKRIRN